MSYEITHTDPRGGDWFDTEAPPPGAPVAGVNPLALMHRWLKGRYLLALMLAGVFAAPCAVLGYRVVPPRYTSVGMVNIQPTRVPIMYQNEQNEPMSAYDSFLQSEATKLRGFRILNAAAQNPELRSKGWPAAPRGLVELDRGLQVTAPSRGQDIFVAVTHEDPALARAAVDAVLEAYKGVSIASQGNNYRETMSELDRLRADYLQRRKDAEDGVQRIADDEGTDDLEARRDAKHQHWARLEALIDEYRVELVRYGGLGQTVSEEPREGEGADEFPTPESLAIGDPELARLLGQRGQIEAEIRSLLQRFTEGHRAVISARADLETIGGMIEARTRLVSRTAPDGGGQTVPAAAMSARQLQEQIATLVKLLESTKEEATRLGKKQLQIDAYRRDAARADEQLKVVEDRIKSLEVETQNGTIGRISIGQEASVPFKPSTDRRIPLAGIGGLGGGVFGVALVAAIGFFFPKYRYIGDIEEATRNVFVFGAIPELDPADPESRQLVAASVHQVRSVIDARLLGTRERATVHVVTSAGAAEGKSTVALRLAKSFAATGRRTLLIDSDMIGRRLTSEFGLLDAQGFADAVTARGDSGRTVHETPIRDLSIMPCGRTDRVDPEEISASRAGTLLGPLQEVFGAIVIDTGPVLGSLEAQAVAPVADEVMLVVTRGREVRSVKMAIDRLHRLGARKIGVVFNRAMRQDIERSTSISVTSQRATEARSQWADHADHPDHHRSNGHGAVARLENAATHDD